MNLVIFNFTVIICTSCYFVHCINTCIHASAYIALHTCIHCITHAIASMESLVCCRAHKLVPGWRLKKTPWSLFTKQNDHYAKGLFCDVNIKLNSSMYFLRTDGNVSQKWFCKHPVFIMSFSCQSGCKYTVLKEYQSLKCLYRLQPPT